MADQSIREFNAQPAVMSSRWNPTPEQLGTLEELYRRGTRTPSTDQIQSITAQLRRYGRIEGKNVFYWFQNHKARERQKRRRQMESDSLDGHQQPGHGSEMFDRKESGASRTSYEDEQTMNWAPSTNYSTLSEESVSISKSTKAGMAEYCRPDGWIEFDERELQHRRNLMERNATRETMRFSLPISHPPVNHHIQRRRRYNQSYSMSVNTRSGNGKNNGASKFHEHPYSTLQRKRGSWGRY
ncbi:hypothetical protein OIU78_017111 [Salix suchowensis]|nr:hypothetical protein OIU78_017111 [Salix suchowensis]